ncbi:hypothetical protein HPB49_017014 [Dermacentor silvarum]|uniref:Uncharacterized protein n=1 Tax=Dermacentor silvarum TaxID=543639 RepID=A0ACB8CY96_DERSI|nr:hypothetical protein HPB49_017014 [Dermacentor silvarum]
MHQQASNDHRPMPLFSQTQQAELDNEVSFIFSQSFLKDSLIMPPQGNAGAKLIDAIIANQINPEHGTKAAPGGARYTIMSRYGEPKATLLLALL